MPLHHPFLAIIPPVPAADERLIEHDGEVDMPLWRVADARRGARRRHVRRQDGKAGGLRRGQPDPTHRQGQCGGRARPVVSHTSQRQREGMIWSLQE